MPLSILSQVFGYPQFRGPQQAIIEHVVAGGDALVLMPTGGGKSLCYQIPAIARQRAGHGIAVVVSPLIALMHDQVGALHEAGVAAAFLNSTQTSEQAQAVEKQMLRGEITLLYAAPERVTTPRFLALLDSLHERGTDEETKALAKHFKVFYAKVPGKTEGNYTIDHTAGSYVFDAKGAVRLFTRHGTGADALKSDLQLLLNGR